MNSKTKILKLLSDMPNTFISGERLAAELGISRAAVCKAVSQLKAEGCEITAITNRGYCLEQIPDRLEEFRLREALQGCCFGEHIHIFKTIDSTNRFAKNLAEEGAPSGTVVIAEEQTAGRGRLGKSFHSPIGGLYISVLIRPVLNTDDMMSVTAATASAVCLALLDLGISPKIKWVNDLFLGEKKICGILSEGTFSMEAGTLESLVIGIGINLHRDPALPDELREIVTDIETETGKAISRTELAAGILRQLEKMIEGIPQRTFLPIYTEHSRTIGQTVQVTLHGTPCIAKAIGYTRNAELIVQLPDGSQDIVYTGTALSVAGVPPVAGRTCK